MADPSKDDQQREIEIGEARPRRLIGLASYVLGLIGIAIALGWLLSRFTNSLIIAIALVAFMVAYMTIMAYFASRNLRR